jgi:hypothetical protein
MPWKNEKLANTQPCAVTLNRGLIFVVAVVRGAIRARWPTRVGAVMPIMWVADFAQVRVADNRKVPVVGAEVSGAPISATTSLLPSVQRA